MTSQPPKIPYHDSIIDEAHVKGLTKLHKDVPEEIRGTYAGKLAEFSQRFTGSADLYKGGYHQPTASINLITAHDGFTLNDLVSYNEKHNESNGEDNNDGANNNNSWNCGVEGPTNDREIIALRNKQKRNLLTTFRVMLSKYKAAL